MFQILVFAYTHIVCFSLICITSQLHISDYSIALLSSKLTELVYSDLHSNTVDLRRLRWTSEPESVCVTVAVYLPCGVDEDVPTVSELYTLSVVSFSMVTEI